MHLETVLVQKHPHFWTSGGGARLRKYYAFSGVAEIYITTGPGGQVSSLQVYSDMFVFHARSLWYWVRECAFQLSLARFQFVEASQTSWRLPPLGLNLPPAARFGFEAQAGKRFTKKYRNTRLDVAVIKRTKLFQGQRTKSSKSYTVASQSPLSLPFALLSRRLGTPFALEDGGALGSLFSSFANSRRARRTRALTFGRKKTGGDGRAVSWWMRRW